MFIEVRNINARKDIKAKHAIKHLLEAHYYGFHYVYLDTTPEQLNIGDFSYAGDFALSALYEIIQDYTEVASILEILKLKAVVDFSFEKRSFSINSTKSELIIPYEKLDKLERLMPTKLVLEDESESEFYNDIIRLSNSNYLFDMKNINYETIHGGGSRTFGEFEKRKRAMVPTLCIVDSDKKHPLAARGSTSGKFPNDQEAIEYWSKYLVLNCHEIENLVPLPILEKALSEEQASSATKMLSGLFPLDSRYIDFADLKKGILHGDAVHIDKGKVKFWTHECVMKAHRSICSHCSVTPSNTNSHPSNACGGYLLPPLGPSIMDSVRRFLNSENPKAIKGIIDDCLSDELFEIIQNIRDWCFARQRSDFS